MIATLISLITIASPQFIAIAPTIYLPVTIKKSKKLGCMVYEVRNTSNREVGDVKASYQNIKGNVRQKLVTNSLKARRTKLFGLCNSALIHVTAGKYIN